MVQAADGELDLRALGPGLIVVPSCVVAPFEFLQEGILRSTDSFCLFGGTRSDGDKLRLCSNELLDQDPPRLLMGASSGLYRRKGVGRRRRAETESISRISQLPMGLLFLCLLWKSFWSHLEERCCVVLCVCVCCVCCVCEPNAF